MAIKRIRFYGWVAIFLLLCLTVVISDSLVGMYRNRGVSINSVPLREIRLREHSPGLVWHTTPEKFGIEFVQTDSLVNKEYVLRADENGFIIPSRIHDSADLTLVFLGGSTTECLFMEETKRFPYLVGRVIENETGKKVNSFNGGRSGNTNFNSVINLLGKVIPLHPNAVIMMETINDLSLLLFERSYWNSNRSRSPIVTIDEEVDHVWFYYVLKGIKNLFVKNLYNQAWDMVHSLQLKRRDEFAGSRRQLIRLDERTPQILDAYRKNLELFISMCRLYGIVPVLMTQQNRMIDPPDPAIAIGFVSYPAMGIQYSDYKRLYDSMHDVVRAVGKENGVLVIDLASRIPPKSEYLYDIVHFTEKGSVEAAGIIAAELKKSILVDRRTSATIQ